MSLHLEDDRYCFVCGEKNGNGLRLTFTLREGKVFSEFTFRKDHQGYKNIVHGGLLSTILDEAMVKVSLLQGIPVVTAGITVRFRNPLLVGEQAFVEAGILRMEEVLRSVPGVIMSQSGGRGGATSLFMRGGNTNYTQVLFNGIRLNDAGGDFDWNALTVDNVDRIEVIQGPMSALYGADAMTGVVNLVTKKGTGPLSLAFTGGWGAHSENGNFTGENRVSLLGSYKKFGYSVAFSRIDDLGILRINNRYANNVLTARLDCEPLEEPVLHLRQPPDRQPFRGPHGLRRRPLRPG